jgi:predicted nucleic acid-binding protein
MPTRNGTEPFSVGDQFLKDFLSQFRRYEIRIGTRLLDRALPLMARYNLSSHDACVAAITFHADVEHLVSLDRKFVRIDGLSLWNNRIPERRRP